jgi:hypothetical protein
MHIKVVNRTVQSPIEYAKAAQRIFSFCTIEIENIFLQDVCPFSFLLYKTA